MADFDVTAPDGRKFRVSAPEGASQDQVLAYAQAQFAKMPKPPQESMLETVAKAPTRFTTGVGETALSLGTGAAASAAAGLLGLVNAGHPSGGDPAATVHNIQEAGTYQPRTEIGKKMLSSVAAPFEILAKGADWAGKKTTDAATAAGASAPVAAGAGTAINTGLQALPMAAGPLAKGVAPLLERGAKATMQNAIKPILGDLKAGDAAQAIDTMLEKGINVTPGGMMELRSQINALNSRIMSAIQNSTGTVNKVRAAQELQGLLDKVTKQATPGADMASVTKAWDEFLSHPLLAGKSEMPVQLAQEIKQGTYRALGDKSYGELKGYDVEAQKTIARGLKDGIAEAVPEISGLNAADSKLINALNVVERRVLLHGNNNKVGLGALITNPEMFAVWMADRSPLLKSLLARAMNSGAEGLPGAGEAVGAAGGAMAGRPKRLQDLQK